MSSDNGIYILQSLDGFRIVHAQAIENLYWWEKKSACCTNPNIVSVDGEEQCYNCRSYLPEMELRDDICPERLKGYFRKSKIFDTEEEALKEAQILYDEIIDDDFCPIVEYGISFIKGWEDKFFPE